MSESAAFLGPWVELLLRAWVGGVLVIYALRSSFGYFPNTGVPVQTIQGTAEYMNRFGWRPGMLWAWLSTLSNLIGGAMLAVGMLTQVMAALSFVLLFLSACHHLRKDGFFANQNGFEHYFLWAVCALYFVVNGGGPYSVDRLIGLPY